VKVQVSLRDTVAPWGCAFPPVELAGYYQWSLRDLLRRCARTLEFESQLATTDAGPGGTV